MDKNNSNLFPTQILNNLQSDTCIELYPLTIRREDEQFQGERSENKQYSEQYIVGRKVTGEFVVLSEIGVQVIELLQHHYPLGEIQESLQSKYALSIDLHSFIADLVDLGFVQAIDSYPLASKPVRQPNLAWLQPRHVRWLFSWPMSILYIALITVAGFTAIDRRELIPCVDDFFWSTSISVSLLSNIALLFIIIVLHELAHLVAARSLNVFAHISLSTRLHHLVVQTDVSGLWAVPRQYRYRVYWAGILWELASMSVAFLLLAYLPLPDVMQSLLWVLILIHFLGIAWQFQLYMRTDVYFVVLDLLRCHNLYEDSLAYLRFRWQALQRYLFPSDFHQAPLNPLSNLPRHERQKVIFYAWLVLMGSTLTLFLFTSYGLPILVTLFVKASTSVWQGLQAHQMGRILDGMTTLLIEGGLQAAFIITLIKRRRNPALS